MAPGRWTGQAIVDRRCPPDDEHESEARAQEREQESSQNVRSVGVAPSQIRIGVVAGKSGGYTLVAGSIGR